MSDSDSSITPIEQCPDCDSKDDECRVVGCPNYVGPRVVIRHG